MSDQRHFETGRSESTPDELLDYARQIGSVVVNLLSLEFALRVALSGGYSDVQLDDLRVGDRVPSGPLTSYDSLGRVIDAYNSMVKPGERLNGDAIVRLRDMLAHGRLVGRGPRVPFALYKFGRRAKDGTVPVEAMLEASPEWLSAQAGLVANAASRVLQRLRSAPLADADEPSSVDAYASRFFGLSTDAVLLTEDLRGLANEIAQRDDNTTEDLQRSAAANALAAGIEAALAKARAPRS